MTGIKKLRALLSVLLVLSICISFASCSKSNEAKGGYGDLNGDGVCDAADAELLAQYLDKTVNLSDEVVKMADVNGDGNVDTVDLSIMQKYSDGTYSALPVWCTHAKYTDSAAGESSERVCSLCGYAKEYSVAGGVRVAYIPLDNRPANQERVQYLAQSVGIELVMPQEELYRNALDNMEPNPNGLTLGDREALLKWMKEADETCDYFIISLDQVLSGGLVGSRILSNTDLTFEYGVMDEIIDLCKNNTVLLFDTVMRLASTVNYGGYDEAAYNAFRAYGQVARRQLEGDELTLENIAAGYRFDESGSEVKTTLSEDMLEKYHAARLRKLKLTDYILRGAGDDMDFFYLGVDDSTPQTTIQTNEIRYLSALLGDRGVTSAAADELGMCCLARLASMIYGSVGVNISYFGSGKDMPADDFDIETLGANVGKHLVCLGAEESDKTIGALQVLVLTRYNTFTDLISLNMQLKYNLENNLPTVLLDVSGGSKELSESLFGQDGPEVGMLLGYSSWNTAGNAMGMALSMGVARYAYLTAVEESSAEANGGFLRSMTFAYIKDISYKQFHMSVDGITDDSYSCSVPLVLSRLNESRILTSLLPYSAEKHSAVSASNFRYPWNRTFEMTFDIAVG